MAEEAKEKTGQAMERVVDPAKTIRTLLDKNKTQIMAALGAKIDPAQFSRIALTTVQRTPKLGEANPWSLLGAIMEAAQSGLSLDKAKREAALVPFWNKNKRQYDVTFMPQYGGYIALAHASGKVSSIFARVVYENEVFKIEYGDDTRIMHTPLPPDKRGEKVIGAYAVAKMKDGEKQAEFMWEDEIMDIKERSRAKDEGPWVTDTDEMRKKTVIRRLAKVLPLSPEWTKMATRDEYREVGVTFPTDFEVETGQEKEIGESGFVEPKGIEEKAGGETTGEREPGADEQEDPPGNGNGEVELPDKAALKILASGSKAKQKQEPGSISSGQMGMIGAILSALGYKSDDRRHFALSRLLGIEVKSAKNLTSAQASAVIEVIKELQK